MFVLLVVKPVMLVDEVMRTEYYVQGYYPARVMNCHIELCVDGYKWFTLEWNGAFDDNFVICDEPEIDEAEEIVIVHDYELLKTFKEED